MLKQTDVLVKARKLVLAKINADHKAVPSMQRTEEMTRQRDEQRTSLYKAEDCCWPPRIRSVETSVIGSS